MGRREKILVRVSLAAFVGVAVVFGSMLFLLWRDWMSAEEAAMGGLARSMGERTQYMIEDTRDLLATLDRWPGPRCAAAHLEMLEVAAASRPHLRSIGYWRAADRVCGVGFLQSRALKPPRADRIYDSGVVAWWPSRHTQVGDTQLFLMRYGNHDVAIDPKMLLPAGLLEDRQVALWVEGLPMASEPAGAELPSPGTVPIGVNVDRDAGLIVSHFSQNAVLPIDVVAIEPLASFWGRHLRTLAAGSVLGLVTIGAWLAVILRYSRQHLGLAGELREALTHGRLTVEYQPIVELATGRWVGAEALARWTRENGDVVSPEVFVPLAEREGFVSAITSAVLKQTLSDVPHLLTIAPAFSVNVNLSPDDLRNVEFALTLAERLDDAGVSARAIKLEITERALVNTDSARFLVEALRERGHEIAIDDFGTGYSSLSYLQRFHLDVLKIDKTFIDGVGGGAASGHVIEHIVDMAQALGLRTVAEGVENEAQRRRLMGLGVQYAQGYLFSPPVSLSALTERLIREEAA